MNSFVLGSAFSASSLAAGFSVPSVKSDTAAKPLSAASATAGFRVSCKEKSKRQQRFGIIFGCAEAVCECFELKLLTNSCKSLFRSQLKIQPAQVRTRVESHINLLSTCGVSEYL